MVNMSSSNNSTPRSINLYETKPQQNHHHNHNHNHRHHNHYNHHQTVPSTTATIPVTRSTIDDFREIVREQSFIIPNNSSSEDNHIDVPVKKYPPLPDIAVPGSSLTNNAFFRTETTLIKPTVNQPKKQMFYHFASTQRGHLPALNKPHNLPSMSNAMDLDEDLPQCYANIAHRVATYTSPGDRIISPIKRPSAPSPPVSAQLKRIGYNAFGYDERDRDQDEEENCSILDDDESQLFYDSSYFNNNDTSHSIRINNHRIDHYGNTNRYLNMSDRQNTMLIDGSNDEPVHPLDSIDFEP